MKIALITDGITPYVIGGMQKHSYYLAKYFAKNKIAVDLFHYNSSGLEISALDIFSEEEKAYITSYVLEFPVSARFPGHYIYRSWKYSEQIFELIKDKLHTYDFIYTKGFSGWKLISEKHKKKIHCCDIGVKFHGYEMYQVAPDRKTKLQHYLLRPFVKKISRQADKVFSYGGKITGIIRQIGVDPGRIIEMPSGIENKYISDSPSPQHQPVKFVFMGRYERRKGIEELNDALTGLIEKKAGVHFGFIGPVPADKKLSAPGIVYFGEIRDAREINAILKEHDVLVCPSWSEGFPNVILEAMANGLAVIATDVGAVSSMVGSANGLLIPPNDKEALSRALLTLQNSENLEALKLNSLTKIREQFNWDHLIKRLIRDITPAKSSLPGSQ